MRKRRNVKKRNRLIGVYTAAGIVCLAAVIFLSTCIANIPLHDSIVSPETASASILADNPLLGYVIVALLSLCLGVLLVVFCIRFKKHLEKEADDV